jgi:serine/threonine protein kinase
VFQPGDVSITGVVGVGSFGQVCPCTVGPTKETAVVKVLSTATEVDKYAQEEYKRELELFSSLCHPRIVRFMGRYEDPSPPVRRGMLLQRADSSLLMLLRDKAGETARAKRILAIKAALQLAEGIQVRVIQPIASTQAL